MNLPDYAIEARGLVKTYAATKAKFGKKTADRQAVAAAMNTARKSAGGSRNQGTKRRKPLKTRAK